MLKIVKNEDKINQIKTKKQIKDEITNKDFFKACNQLLNYMIDKLPESPHKHLKYVHYHNLVYRMVFGADAKEIRESRGKKRKDLMSNILNELELSICGRAFVDLANSISRGDSYQESKSLIVKKYCGILIKKD